MAIGSSTVSSGTVITSGGTTYIAGISSGLNTSALIEAAVAQRTQPADTIDAKIAANTSKVTAYQKMQGLLKTLQGSLDALRNTDSANTSDNVFTKNATYLSTSGSTAATNILGASADQTATPGTYSLEVDQVAQAEKVSSTSISSYNTTLGYSGSFVLGSGSSSATLSVTPDMSLDAVQSLIDGNSSNTGVSASIVHVSPTDSRLILSATATDQPITTSSLSGDNVLHDLGVTDGTGSIPSGQILQQPQAAQFKVNGVAATRTSNTITDAIDGVTLNLYQASVGQTVNMEVATDVSAVKNEIETFVTNYNAYRSFVLTQEATASDGTASSTATLFGDGLLQQTDSSVASPLSASIATGNGGLTSLAAIGISLDQNNNLTVDDTALNTALTSNFSAVKSLFEYQSSTSNSELSVFEHGTGSAAGSFTLNIATDASGHMTGATVQGDSNSDFSVSGGRIIGNPGTAYAGMVMIYTGSTGGSMTVNVSKGIAEQMYQSTVAADDPSSGSLQSAINNLQTQDNDFTLQSATIRTNASDYRTQLLNKYAAMETALSAAKTTNTQLLAILNVNSSG